MPINRDLNVDPYFDDFDLEKQFYRVLFKPSYAVQARELTQLQTILQNQIEQFGDNIFKEGSIVKGCNFIELEDLKYVKVTDKTGFDVQNYVGFEDTIEVGGEVFARDNVFELRGDSSNVTARIVAATRGFETRNPDLNTFYINYTNTSAGGNKVFQNGELLKIYKISTVEVGASVSVEETEVESINVTTFTGATGNSFGLRSGPGVVFQKGHFLYSEEQLVIVSKYTNTPDNVSVGFVIEERIINAFQDSSLYDNANGSFNQNAPGADRLKLIPVLTAIPTTTADTDTTFFTLIRYANGNAITIRDVSQYNVLGEEMARRTYEESGDYVVNGLKTKVIRRNGNLTAAVSSGLAYVKGYRIKNHSEIFLPIDEIANTSIEERTNQAVSFNYGNYIDLVDTVTSGTVTLGTFETVDLKNEAASTIGTARVRNVTDTKIHLFDIRLTGSNKIYDIDTIYGDTGFLTVANNAIIKEAGAASMVFDTGMISLKTTSNISIPVRDQRSLSGLSGTTFYVANTAGEDFNLENDDILFVDSTNIKIDVVSAVKQPDGRLLVTLADTPSSTGTIYFNTRIVDASPFTKVSTDLYVKSTFANTDVTSSSKFNLGFPDVYEIVSIEDADGNDVTASFKLKSNQRDNYYDHSYIEFIPGRPAPVDGLMSIHMKAFKLGVTTGEYFFNVDSYPTSVPKNKIQPFTSSSGRTYNLRDCLDFRPFVEPLSPATYAAAEVEGTAPTVSNSSTGINVAPSFSSSYTILTPAANQYGQLDYEFHLNRVDSVVVDSYGKITVQKGSETSNSVPPLLTGDVLKIADINIPGIPALTPEEAYTQDRQQYSTRVIPRGVKSYRMKDIENLEKKIDNLRYYVLLSALEAETKNLNIVDENGLTRFKNGIIVDPFNDLSIANLQNAEFNAAIDFTEKSLMPAVKTYPINLKFKSSSNASIFPSTANAKVATLQRNIDVSIISQPYATNFRNCVANFYNYKGLGTLVPEYDTVYDTVTNPVSIDIDLITPFTEFAEAIQEFVPLTSTSSELVNSVVTDRGRRGFLGFGRRRGTVEETWLDTTRFVQVSGEQVNEQRVGDFVTNFSFNPYMRSRDIKVYVAGLRPNTQHYFFFDKVDVNAFVTPGNVTDQPDAIQRNGNAGDPILSDDNGVIRAVFTLPEATFFVGDRNLEIADVNSYDDIENGAISYGLATYRAYNFSIEKSSLTVATRTPEQFVDEITSERTVTRRARRRRGKDPIAQTFFVKKGMTLGSDTVFVSKVDLYFKRKSSVNGVIVDLREVINGYPSYNIIPFSKVHLTPAQVNVSDDASLATVISFPAPVRLDAEKEYALVVTPDGADPEYLIFTSKVGGTDLTPGDTQGLGIIQDWGDGVLFSSTNGTAWESYQDEDMKFTVYRHNFISSSGSVTLTNDDNEFITTTNNIGRFIPGEIAYVTKSKDASTSSTVSVLSGNNQIEGTNVSATYAAGDHILIDDGSTNKQILRVESSNSTVIVADRPASFTDGTVNAYPVVIGNISHYDFRYPEFIILEGSSANSTRKFIATDTMYGFDSDTQATISSVDNKEFSYIQPMILRTNDIVTNTTLSGTFVDPSNPTNTYTQSMTFDDKTLFGTTGMVVYSKSNDIPRTKTLDLTVGMTNSGNVTSSPFVDIETASLLAYEWKITNDSDTTSKYISKTIELAESLDAEDLQVYATIYRPNGTDVKIFIKPQAAEDPSAFDTNDWIELEITSGVNVYSAISNPSDFREYVYRVPATSKTAFGALTYTNDISTFEGYRRFAIKIELHSENIFKAPRLLDYRGIALT